MHDTGHVPNLSEVADRLAIHDVLATHSRGIDRADTEILKTAYWPDAIVYYGAFEGSAHTFCERGRYLDRMQRRSGVWKIIERRRDGLESAARRERALGRHARKDSVARHARSERSRVRALWRRATAERDQGLINAN